MVVLRDKATEATLVWIPAVIFNQDLQSKMNDNYKLVAELSAENLKLSAEKLRMEQLVDEVRKDQALLKGELNKAQSVVEAMNSASPRLPGRRFQPHLNLNRPRHLNLNGELDPDIALGQTLQGLWPF